MVDEDWASVSPGTFPTAEEEERETLCVRAATAILQTAQTELRRKGVSPIELRTSRNKSFVSLQSHNYVYEQRSAHPTEHGHPSNGYARIFASPRLRRMASHEMCNRVVEMELRCHTRAKTTKQGHSHRPSSDIPTCLELDAFRLAVDEDWASVSPGTFPTAKEEERETLCV